MIVFIQGVFAVLILIFAVYVLIEFKAVLRVRRHRRKALDALTSTVIMDVRADYPRVSVLLPVYNESAVIERLIDAVASLDYPADRYEILVLDDSTDHTTEIATARIAWYAERGRDIRLVRRQKRSGYKAGNLSNGIREANGAFIAIFDADFLPPIDFLLRTIPCFDDAKVGYLQTGIGYINRDASFLTRFQAMIMGHQQFVTQGLSEKGLMGSLSGSACVWRRSCVESLGGWKSDTITEDVDLGYRAQFNNWKYAYLRDVVCLSELPERISAIRVQRDRWARGLIDNAFRHGAQVWQKQMPWPKRLQALSLMFSSLLLASFTVLMLLALPLAIHAEQLGWFFHLCSASFVGLLLIWVYSNAVGTEDRGAADAPAQRKPLIGRLISLYPYVAMFQPLSLYYFVAAIQVISGREGGFNRTPKGESADADVPRIDAVLRLLERLALLYALVTLFFSLIAMNFWLIVFSAVCCSGFGITTYFSIRERSESFR